MPLFFWGEVDRLVVYGDDTVSRLTASLPVRIVEVGRSVHRRLIATIGSLVSRPGRRSPTTAPTGMVF